jgi:hypothetical protein
MAYTYTTWKSALASLGVYTEANANFVAILPSVIDYAEQRLYRELNLLSTVVRDTGGSTANNTRNFTLPQTNGRFVVIDAINVFTPAGSQTTRNPVLPVSLNYIDLAWPEASSTGSSVYPTHFAMVTDQTLVWGPTPGATYTVEVIGHIRPTPLSEANPNTFLTDYLPDLFMAASMIFLSGYQKNFGAQADDPRQAQSWETQYQALFSSANVEEIRRKFAGPGWSSKQPQPLAATPR